MVLPPQSFIARVRAAAAAIPNIRLGFPTPADYAAAPIIVELIGLCPDVLGYNRYRRVYQNCVLAAQHLAPTTYLAHAIHIGGARIGYEFRFPDRMSALCFKHSYHVALYGHSPADGAATGRSAQS